MKKKIILIILGLLVILGIVTSCSNRSNTDQAAKNQIVEKNRKYKKANRKKQKQIKIKIRINGQTLNATLNNSSAGKAFAKELPITMKFRTFMAGYPEKIADLHHALPTKGMPKGHAGTKGSIGYWGPDQRIVFYYGTVGYYKGIHIIGKFTSKKSISIIKNMNDNTVVKIIKAK